MGPLITQFNRLKNVGLVEESSPDRGTTALDIEEDAVSPSIILEASRHPCKEPIGVNDGVEGRAETPSNQIENGGGDSEGTTNSTRLRQRAVVRLRRCERWFRAREKKNMEDGGSVRGCFLG
ncbi:uncharacterized protein A4U43_C04F23850 [Asparagus officinalis]|uniref:Uncharacterized protein n=1 Tax=Asparagus officinalis TaxID=4686 RepID=A0A5P1F3B0_ASPOF|nr:uncharacterized protein A4U43_C04F23850 [Asparagus officinalis]